MASYPGFTRRLLLGHGFGAALLLPPAARADAATKRPQPTTAGRLPLVVIDPGHGGKDPGAIGARGTYEKHIAFAAACELARRLRASGRCQVALTRERDVFVPLDDRVGEAERQKAALFVSLHADAVLDHNVHGASVYTLAGAASDPQTAALAERENAAGRRGGASADGVSPQVAGILASLVRHETRIGSARLQRQIVTSMAASQPLLENPSRHAGFAVLKSASIPSILVEMGFMSNPHDEAALCTAAHRGRVANSIRHAVEAYLAASGQLMRDAG